MRTAKDDATLLEYLLAGVLTFAVPVAVAVLLKVHVPRVALLVAGAVAAVAVTVAVAAAVAVLLGVPVGRVRDWILNLLGLFGDPGIVLLMIPLCVYALALIAVKLSSDLFRLSLGLFRRKEPLKDSGATPVVAHRAGTVPASLEELDSNAETRSQLPAADQPGRDLRGVDLRQHDRLVAEIDGALRRFEKGAPPPLVARDLLAKLAACLAESSPADAGLSPRRLQAAREAAVRGFKGLKHGETAVQAREAKRALRSLARIFRERAANGSLATPELPE